MAAVRPVCKKLIIVGVYPGGSTTQERLGGAWYGPIVKINQTLRQRYPQHYAVDDRGRDLHRMLVDAYNGDATDTIDYDFDIVPTSLRADGVHLNPAGYTAWGQWAKIARDRLFR